MWRREGPPLPCPLIASFGNDSLTNTTWSDKIMMANLNFLQWAGAATGVAGTMLLAIHGPWSKFGFLFYLASNACWIKFGVATKTPGLTVQNLAFLASSLLGVWFWILKPA